MEDKLVTEFASEFLVHLGHIFAPLEGTAGTKECASPAQAAFSHHRSVRLGYVGNFFLNTPELFGDVLQILALALRWPASACARAAAEALQAMLPVVLQVPQHIQSHAFTCCGCAIDVG